MKWTGRRKLITGVFGAALGVLIFIAILSYRTTSLLIQSGEARRQSYERALKLDTLLSELKDAETGQRGYLLTGRQNYLEPYDAALTRINQTIIDMRHLTAGNPESRNAMRALEGLIKVKLSELQQTVILQKEGKGKAALQIVLRNDGKKTMDEIRKLTDEMQDQEVELLRQRDREMTATARWTVRALLFGTSLSFVTLLAVFFLLRREIIERQAVEMKLRGNITERKKAQEELAGQAVKLGEQAAIMDLAHDAIFVRDMEDRIQFWNHGAEERYGWREEETLGKVAHTLLQTQFPGPTDQIKATLLRAGRWEGELIHKTRHGAAIVVASRWALQRDEAGIPKAILEINNDITPRIRGAEKISALNQELKLKTADLEATNKELEAFTYSVAHDLRAPLRHIDGFSRMLEEETDAFPDEAKRLVMRIREGARHMGQLVDDLLNLARLGRQGLSLHLAGLSTLAEEAAVEIQKESAGRSIEWKIGALPFVECDPGLIRQVFVNLLSNAAKYSRPRQHALIEVGVKDVDGQSAIFIRDNGVGFSMKYADKLFGVFQRLHRAEDFEGTGIGLATVERIIRKHGGRVWAEAELDQGATFYFTMEAQKSESGNQKKEGSKETELSNVQTVEVEHQVA